MSNLIGSCKVNVAEVQGVDVAREQERRARLQLLDDMREPSPTPIFGEPVKVDLEDETSLRIKNTLGDFTQVLVNDPKHLIGISRLAPVVGHPMTGHPLNENCSISTSGPLLPNEPSVPDGEAPSHGARLRPSAKKLTGLPSARTELTLSPILRHPQKAIDSNIAVETILKNVMGFIKDPVTAIPKTPDRVPKITEGVESSPNLYISSSLRDDLEMSDSEFEEIVEIEKIASKNSKSPTIPSKISEETISTTAADTKINDMDINSAESSNSSSSESGDSDSDESSSESNDSDSSSEELLQVTSNEDTSSKKWALSNFVDESRRNLSPAFMQVDALAKAERQKSIFTCDLNPASISIDETPVECKPGFSPTVTDQNFSGSAVPPPNRMMSPLPLQSHTAIGPRTPPSPPCSMKNYSPPCNEYKMQEQSSDIQINTDVLKSVNSTNSHFTVSHVNCDKDGGKGNVQNDKCKKQSRPSKPKKEYSICENTSSANVYIKSCDNDEEKNIPLTCCGVVIETVNLPKEPSHKDYSIKLRQRTSTSFKKIKSIANSPAGNQKANYANSIKIGKMKHPRACRLSTEIKTVKPCIKSTSNSGNKINVGPKKKSKLHLKVKTNLDKRKNSVNIQTLKNTSKTLKSKNKLKSSFKSTSHSKKQNVKKKKKKFAIKDFLQSPNYCENGRPPSHLPAISPSPERSPIPEHKDSTEIICNVDVCCETSRGKSRLNAKKFVKIKKIDKLRRSVRCSKRTSSHTQNESDLESQNNNEDSKKLSLCHSANLHMAMDAQLELLSPIPQDSPLSLSILESSIPFRIMVCIPLNKLLRIPSLVTEAFDNEHKLSQESSIHESFNEVQQCKKDIPEKISKNSIFKHSDHKRFKDQSRTFNLLNCNNEKNNQKCINSKSVKEISKNKIPLNLSTNTVIKSSETLVSDEDKNKISMKRKMNENRVNMKKKIKLFKLKETKSKEISSSSNSGSISSLTEGTSKNKELEHCDSNSSLSSVYSQQIQINSKFSKGKKKESILKNNAPIKQEKIDVSAISHIKKESLPLTSTDKTKLKNRDKTSKDIESRETICNQLLDDISSQYCHWEDSCKKETKGRHLFSSLNSVDKLSSLICQGLGSDWDHFVPELHMEFKDTTSLNKHNKQTPIMPMDYFWTEGNTQRQLAEKEKDPYQQAVKFFEAAVLYILTSQQREEYSKDPDSIYQFYQETLKFSCFLLSRVRKLQQCPGSTEFKLLILCLKCQSLLYVKLYNLKIKEIKEQLDGVTDFLRHQSSSAFNSRTTNQTFHQSRITNISNVSSPISSPTSSINSQTSGYVSSDISGNSARGTVLHSQTASIPKSIMDMICRQHNHFINLHMGHDLWEQADMYMTRSNLREFFKEVADQSEPLTLHSSIKELVNYVQKGISMVKKNLR